MPLCNCAICGAPQDCHFDGYGGICDRCEVLLDESAKVEQAIWCSDNGHTIEWTGSTTNIDGYIPPGEYVCICCGESVIVGEEESWDMLSKDG